jgi:uncharacterized membrane protein YgcG
MASGGHGQVEPDRLDPAKLAPFPKALDINSDILIPQFSDKWMMELKAALGSRFQFEVLEEADPTLDQIFEWYEDTGYSNEQLTTFYDAILQKRHEKRRLATLNLLAAIKDESLTMMQREKLLKFGDMHDAVSIYKFICEVCDLSAGLSQDKIRAKYAKVKIAATDSASTIIKQIELKWWLLRKHTNYGLASAPAVLEAVKQVIKMLLDGPPRVAASAALEFTTISPLIVPNVEKGNEWIELKVEMFKQQGEMLCQPDGAAFGMLGDGGKGGKGKGGKGGGRGGGRGAGGRGSNSTGVNAAGCCKLQSSPASRNRRQGLSGDVRTQWVDW